MSLKLDGKALADRICGDLKDRCDVLRGNGITPRLTIVTTNSDPASFVYIRNKIRRCKEIGIEVDVQCFSTIGVAEIRKLYKEDAIIKPIIFQMPLKTEYYVSLEKLRDLVSPEADVDGFLNTRNIAAVASGRAPANYPCTPKGITRLLDEYQIPVEGENVCVIGRSNIVGRPLARILGQKNATVTLCHSKTNKDDLVIVLGAADIIVSATGNKDLFSFKYLFGHDREFLSTKTIVDVGINYDEKGRLCGDFPAWAYEHCKAYTPVPGGVGPMTVAMLMENVILFYERRK